MGRAKNRPGTFNRKRYWHLCDNCGQQFQCSRPDAKFHDANCRSAFWRKMKAIDERYKLLELDRVKAVTAKQSRKKKKPLKVKK